MTLLSDTARTFCERSRVARLATADAKGVPHLVPVCYAIIDATLYITIDEKPKRVDVPLKRIRNIRENPEVAVTIDRWDEDWRRLAWVMLRGRAEILTDGPEHDMAQRRLRERYPQYRAMDLAPLPVIALRIARAASWGDLGDDPGDVLGRHPRGDLVDEPGTRLEGRPTGDPKRGLDGGGGS